jgi:uncharacterized membrane protein YdjX (TVP38/TMEM64 family)
LTHRFLSNFSWPAIIAVLFTVLPVITSSILGAWAIREEAVISSWTNNQWLIVTIVLAVASAIALSPPTLLAVIFGYFLNWMAFPYLLTLNLSAISLVYCIVSYIDNGTLIDQLQKAYPSIKTLLNRFRSNQLRLVFFMKLSPLFPFAITNLVFVLSRASFSTIVLGGMAGMIPRTLLAIWIGIEAKELRVLIENPNEKLEAKVALFILLLVSTLGTGYFFRNQVTKEPQ